MVHNLTEPSMNNLRLYNNDDYLLLAEWVSVSKLTTRHLNSANMNPNLLLEVAEWVKETRPNKRYRITTTFECIPKGIIGKQYAEDTSNDMYVITESDIEEVYE